MKHWYHSKTLWFNALTLALGIFEVVSQTYVFPPDMLILVNGVGNVILRFLTKEGIDIG